MRIASFSFDEMRGMPQKWSLDATTFEDINLLVGKNASGKTRILNCVKALAALLSTRPERIFSSGNWKVELDHEGAKYHLVIKIDQNKITHESLHVDGILKLSRKASGEGVIWNDQVGRELDFKIDDNVLAMFQKRDEKQHTFLEPLYNWAEKVRHYPFGSDFGKSVLFALPLSLDEEATDALGRDLFDHKNIVALYHSGYEKFGKEFDRKILDDFKAVGYACSQIDETPLADFYDGKLTFVNGKIAVGLQVKEVGMRCPTRQIEMSSGMFRSLALVIHINYSELNGDRGTILIDDIGEGLDFERSSALIRHVKDRCLDAGIQLIMSTNDRFVMNEIDLKYWHVVTRKGSKVHVLDWQNSEKEFQEFRFLGLSNFDFFSMQAYKAA